MPKSKKYSSDDDEGLDHFKKHEFDGTKSTYREYTQELRENLRAKSLLHLSVLFPITPWILGEDNIPTNLPDKLTFKARLPALVVGRGNATQALVDAREEKNNEIDTHNDSLYDYQNDYQN